MARPRSHSLSSLSMLTNQPLASDEVTQAKARELLALVDKAKYDKIEQIWKCLPELMLMTVTDENGSTTTPLKRAFFNLDTYTWKPFYEWIKLNRFELVQKFLEQNDEQQEHIDIHPLLAHGYEATINEIYASSRTKQHIPAAVCILKKSQTNLLPWHMIREMCREGDSWSAESNFDSARAFDGGRAYDCETDKWLAIDSADFLNSKGFLYRSIEKQANYVELWSNTAALEQGQAWFSQGRLKVAAALESNVKTLARLQEVRRANLAEIPRPLPCQRINKMK